MKTAMSSLGVPWITLLVSLVAFGIGPVACSDAGQPGSRAIVGAGGAGGGGQMASMPGGAPGASGAFVPAMGAAGTASPPGPGGTSSPPGAPGAGGALVTGEGGSVPLGGTTSAGGAITTASGGVTDTGGATSGTAGQVGAGGAAPQDYGVGDGSDVITIGDSWMQIITNGGGIEAALDRAGTHYRHYAIPGTTLINGDIPAQYDRAKAANPKIATVIMTGGGNDIMFTGGCATKEACTMSVQMLVDAFNQLWTKMAADGVTSVVLIEYSKNAGTTPSDTRPDNVPIPSICLSGKIRCLSIDTTDLVARTDTVDGIHPTLPACDRIAKATLDKMAMSGVRR